jgi:hypothetical protein
LSSCAKPAEETAPPGKTSAKEMGAAQQPAAAKQAPAAAPKPTGAPANLAAKGSTGKQSRTPETANAAAGAINADTAKNAGTVKNTVKVRLLDRDAEFRIARDYNQQLSLRIQNVSANPHKIAAEMEPPGGGLIGDFVGTGAKVTPLELAAGASGTLVLALFAQDARRGGYDPPIKIKEAATGETLAEASLHIRVPLPTFALEARTGSPDEGTLAVPIEVANKGEALTDVTVEASPGLLGKVYFTPDVDHARLGTGERLAFHAVPVLSADFSELKGDVTIRGAGQSKDVAVRFKLPEGKRVFVASSGSLYRFPTCSWYCTNNPNTNTSMGGPSSGGRYHHRLPPIRVPQGQRDYDPVEDPGLPGRNAVNNISNPPPGGRDADRAPTSNDLNLGSPVNKAVNKIVENGVKQAEDVANVLNAMGEDAYRSFTGHPSAAFRDQATVGTRGSHLRPAYASSRPEIKENNAPEASWSIVGRHSARPLAVFAWHSRSSAPKEGRQILFWARDARSRRNVFPRPLRLSHHGRWAHWPICVGLHGRRVLVVWEEAADDDGDPSIDYCVSDDDLENWSPPIAVPGAEATRGEGSFSPFPIVSDDGQATIVWQRGTGKAARLMLARATDKGVLGPPATIGGLPAGASRPVPRPAADGGFHLVFEAPPDKAEPGIQTAVFYARIPKDANAATKVTRLSPPNVDAGEADLLVQEPALHVAFRAGGPEASQVLHVQSGDDGATWIAAAPATSDDVYAEYPQFLPQDDGSANLAFYGDARRTKSRPTILKRFGSKFHSGRWTSPERRLTHFPAIETAWMEMKLQPRTSRNHYFPHELKVLFNDRALLHQQNVIPEGNYLLPCDPRDFRSDPRGAGHNVVGLRTRHMNPGHYSYATGFQLKVRQKFSERLVIAKSQEEADEIVGRETSEANHSRPDVGLFNNHLTPLPSSPKNGESIRLKLLAANVGEGPAEEVRLDVYASEPGAGLKPTSPPLRPPISIGSLEPSASKMVEVEFPYDGKERYFVVVTCKGEDFDTENNVHMASFPPPPRPQIEPSRYGQDGELVIRTSDDPSPPSLVRVLDAQSKREVARIENGRLSGPVPTGDHLLAVTRFRDEGEEIVFPQTIHHERGRRQEVPLRTSIALTTSDDSPPIWRWESVRADDPSHVVQWQSGERPVMLLPPGDYRVAIHPTPHDYNSQRLVFPQTIHLEEDQNAVVRLTGGIELAVPERYDPLWKWEVLPAGSAQTVVQWQSGELRKMLLPPGRYRVAVHPTPHDYNSQRMIWSQSFDVAPDQFTRVALTSGVEIETPRDVKDPVWRWELIDAHESKQIVQWQSGDRPVMLVPPGDYRVAIHPTQHDYNSQRLVFPETVHLDTDQRAVIRLTSGIELAIPERYDPLWKWEVLSAGSDQAVVQWQSGALRKMLLPPGRYRVAVHPTQYDYNSQRMIWSAAFDVALARFTRAALDSGVEIKTPGDSKERPWKWEIVDARDDNKVVQWQSGDRPVMLVPPGDYRVAVHPTQYDYNSQRLVWPEKLTVTAGKPTVAALGSGVRFAAPADKQPEFQFRFLKPKSNAQVQWGNAPHSVQLLPPGEYRVEVRKTQWDSWQTHVPNITVEAGKIREVPWPNFSAVPPPKQKSSGAGIRRN